MLPYISPAVPVGHLDNREMPLYRREAQPFPGLKPLPGKKRAENYTPVGYVLK